ncbi:hypothetical protein B0H14DRAFT_3565918 [Mycena olivaceomarginata]|nr:hypothetical protein B0H14DRAFT_3565918 [Mycena olivaceomarginata]
MLFGTGDGTGESKGLGLYDGGIAQTKRSAGKGSDYRTTAFCSRWIARRKLVLHDECIVQHHWQDALRAKNVSFGSLDAERANADVVNRTSLAKIGPHKTSSQKDTHWGMNVSFRPPDAEHANAGFLNLITLPNLASPQTVLKGQFLPEFLKLQSETFTLSVTPSDTFTRSATPSATQAAPTLHLHQHLHPQRHLLADRNYHDAHAEHDTYSTATGTHTPYVPPLPRAGLPALAPRLRPQYRCLWTTGRRPVVETLFSSTSPQITSRGLHPQTLSAILSGTLLATHRAHALAPGSLALGTGRVENGTINRSPPAYHANPAAERPRYSDAGGDGDQEWGVGVLRFAEA